MKKPSRKKVPEKRWYLQGTWRGNDCWATLDKLWKRHPTITIRLSEAFSFEEEWLAESFRCRSDIYHDFRTVLLAWPKRVVV